MSKEQKVNCDNCGDEIRIVGMIDVKGRIRVPNPVSPAGVLLFKEIHLRAQDFCTSDCLDEWVEKQTAKMPTMPTSTGRGNA